ncbi:MAG TPA: hypothetical protein VLA84_21490, partial [Microcoleus sp.]|nr:hypothetical protein [Microcoleus sp.]
MLRNVDRPHASDSQCWMGNIIKTHCYWRSKSGISLLSPELSQPAIKVPTCGTLDQVNILADFKLSSDRSYVPNHICPFPNR